MQSSPIKLITEFLCWGEIIAIILPKCCIAAIHTVREGVGHQPQTPCYGRVVIECRWHAVKVYHTMQEITVNHASVYTAAGVREHVVKWVEQCKCIPILLLLQVFNLIDDTSDSIYIYILPACENYIESCSV